MTIKTKKPRGIGVPTKMPKLEFNRKAIEEIKKRKKGCREKVVETI